MKALIGVISKMAISMKMKENGNGGINGENNGISWRKAGAGMKAKAKSMAA